MLHTFLSTNQERIIAMLYKRIYQTAQTPTQFIPHVLWDNIAKGATAFIAALQPDDPRSLDDFIANLIAPRTAEEFP